jgi:hypothetical protein
MNLDERNHCVVDKAGKSNDKCTITICCKIFPQHESSITRTSGSNHIQVGLQNLVVYSNGHNTLTFVTKEDLSKAE